MDDRDESSMLYIIVTVIYFEKLIVVTKFYVIPRLNPECNPNANLRISNGIDKIIIKRVDVIEVSIFRLLDIF